MSASKKLRERVGAPLKSGLYGVEELGIQGMVDKTAMEDCSDKGHLGPVLRSIAHRLCVLWIHPLSFGEGRLCPLYVFSDAPSLLSGSWTPL